MLPCSFAARLVSVLLLCGFPFVAAFPVAGCQHHAEADTPASGQPTQSAAPAPEGLASAAHVVVPASQQDGVLPAGNEWTPDERVISAMEQEIGTLFTHPDSRLQGLLTRDHKPPRTAPFPLSEYNVRYCGVEFFDGRKVVVGHAAHRQDGYATYLLRPPETESPERRLKTLYRQLVAGGGPYFFTALFDASAGKLLYVRYNAPL